MPDDVEAYQPHDFVAPPKAPKGWAVAGICCGVTSLLCEVILKAIEMYYFGKPNTRGSLFPPVDTRITTSLILLYYVAFFLAVVFGVKALYMSGKYHGAGKRLAITALVIAMFPTLLLAYHAAETVIYYMGL